MINQMVAELQSIASRTRRQWESDAAERANNRDYNLSQESKDALERGDRQRKTGVYQTEYKTSCLRSVVLESLDEWYYYSTGEFVEDLSKIQRLLGSVLYELETVSGLDDKNYIRRVED